MMPQKCINKGCPGQDNQITSFFEKTVRWKGIWRVFKIINCQVCKTEWKHSDRFLNGKEVKLYKAQLQKRKKNRPLPKVIAYDKTKKEAK
nr:MAG: hypothetical protein [Podoviridae sp. ctka020]